MNKRQAKKLAERVVVGLAAVQSVYGGPEEGGCGTTLDVTPESRTPECDAVYRTGVCPHCRLCWEIMRDAQSNVVTFCEIRERA